VPLVDTQHDRGALQRVVGHGTPVSPVSPLDELELLELEDDLPLLELELELEDELDEALPLLLEEDEELPPVTVIEVSVGRPLPLPQNPKDAVPPLAARAWL
jgi:hypothetical protein